MNDSAVTRRSRNSCLPPQCTRRTSGRRSAGASRRRAGTRAPDRAVVRPTSRASGAARLPARRRACASPPGRARWRRAARASRRWTPSVVEREVEQQARRVEKQAGAPVPGMPWRRPIPRCGTRARADAPAGGRPARLRVRDESKGEIPPCFAFTAAPLDEPGEALHRRGGGDMKRATSGAVRMGSSCAASSGCSSRSAQCSPVSTGTPSRQRERRCV